MVNTLKATHTHTHAHTHTHTHTSTSVLLQSVTEDFQGPDLVFVLVLAPVLFRLQHVNVKLNPIMRLLMVCVTSDLMSLLGSSQGHRPAT